MVRADESVHTLRDSNRETCSSMVLKGLSMMSSKTQKAAHGATFCGGAGRTVASPHHATHFNETGRAMSIGSSCRLCVSCINRKNTFPSCIAQLVVILKVMYFPVGPILGTHPCKARRREMPRALLMAPPRERHAQSRTPQAGSAPSYAFRVTFARYTPFSAVQVKLPSWRRAMRATIDLPQPCWSLMLRGCLWLRCVFAC